MRTFTLFVSQRGAGRSTEVTIEAETLREAINKAEAQEHAPVAAGWSHDRVS